MSQHETPEVYLSEGIKPGAGIPRLRTGLPVFIGYMGPKADEGLAGVPVRIASFQEFEDRIGQSPETLYDFSLDAAGEPVLTPVAASRFLLPDAVRLYFENFRGDCWILPVKGRSMPGKPVVRSLDDFGDELWTTLETLVRPDQPGQPDLLVLPDAVLMDVEDCYRLYNKALRHCADIGDRFAILDVHGGDQPRSDSFEDDVISGSKGFRSLVYAEKPSYGAAYYPWLKTYLRKIENVSLTMITPSTRAAALDLVEKDPQRPPQNPTRTLFEEAIERARTEGVTDADLRAASKVLAELSPVFVTIMEAILSQENILPPSAAVAGVYAATDDTKGVWKAPANAALSPVDRPCIAITTEDQGDLNGSPDGKAINAIRYFVGDGTRVWGARTLDGNSLDWRYIQVRRTVSAIERDIQLGLRSFVFSPNDKNTWTAAVTLIESYLTGLWREGALAGAQQADAFGVSAGLGTTMTDQDLLDGIMRVTVKLAPVHPAEFVILVFEQQVEGG